MSDPRKLRSHAMSSKAERTSTSVPLSFIVFRISSTYKGKKINMTIMKNYPMKTIMLSPKVHETIGSWSPDSLKLMKDLGSRVPEATCHGKNMPNLSCSKV